MNKLDISLFKDCLTKKLYKLSLTSGFVVNYEHCNYLKLLCSNKIDEYKHTNSLLKIISELFSRY